MNDELEQIEQLDVLDREIDRLSTEIAKSNARLSALDSALDSATTALAEARSAVEHHKTEERATQRKLDDLATNRKSALRVLETGIGSADAAQRQLERCDVLIDETESAMLAVLEAQDKAAATSAQATAALALAKADATRGHAEIPATIARAETDRAALRTQREGCHGKLASDLRSRYDDFRARNRFATTRIQSGGCNTCGYTVQLQMLADLQRGRLVTCQGCHRWLLPPK